MRGDITHQLWRRHAVTRAGTREVIHDLIMMQRRVTTLHAKCDTPVTRWTDACEEHVTWWDSGQFTAHVIKACENCRSTDYDVCSHCEWPNNEWPCPTVVAVFPQLKKDQSSDH